MDNNFKGLCNPAILGVFINGEYDELHYSFVHEFTHASLRQYWRIEPLPEDCRELTEKYISGLSYFVYPKTETPEEKA